MLDADGEQWPGSFDAVGSPSDGLLERLARGEADHPRAAIAAAAPVLGLRPTRARLARTCHVPKRRKMTGSPCRKLALMVVRIASTAASA